MHIIVGKRGAVRAAGGSGGSNLIRAAVLAAALISTPQAFGQCPRFPGLAVELPADGARSAADDFNGDGIADVAITVFTDASVHTLLGSGNGRFTPGPRTIVGFSPSSLVPADLNADGAPDLVLLNGTSDTIVVLIGIGDGSFVPSDPIATLDDPTGVATHDVNGDERPDLLVGHNISRAMSVFIGLGDGTFGTRIDSFSGVQVIDFDVADFNRDGDADVVLQNGQMLLGDGTGRFPTRREPDQIFLGRLVESGDFNSDGWFDAVCASAGTTISSLTIYMNDGAGFLRRGAPATIPLRINAMETVDIIGDTSLDLLLLREDRTLVSSRTMDLRILRGGSDGTFTFDVDVPATYGLDTPLIRDLNRDGMVDLVAAQRFPWIGPSHLGVWLRGEEGFLARSDLLLGIAASAQAVGDLNGDGRPDIVTANNAAGNGRSLSVILNRGGRKFASPSQVTTSSAPWAVELADLDNDGDLDAAATLGLFASSGNAVGVFLNDTTGSLRQESAFPLVGTPRDLEFGDLDGDGDIDALVTVPFSSGQDSGVLLFKNSGAGEFTLSQRIVTESGTAGIALADLDGDGDLDAAVTNADAPSSPGRISLLRNAGGVFSIERILETPTIIGQIAAGDIEFDGASDLAVVVSGPSPTSQILLVYRSTGPFLFERVEISTSGSPWAVEIADVDADAQPDLLVGYQSTNVLSLYRNRGDGTLLPEERFMSRYGALDLTVADLDGDGMMDVASNAWEASQGRHVSIHWNLAPCRADIDCAGVVDAIDLARFVECFRLGQPCAELDGVPGVDLGDFFAFFDSYDGGC